VFRGKLLSGLSEARLRGALHLTAEQAKLHKPEAFAALLRALRSQEWVVYAKQPFAGPQQVLAYLARYTHRIAISNERLLSDTGGHVRFRYRDRRRDNRPRRLTSACSERGMNNVVLRMRGQRVADPGRYTGQTAIRCPSSSTAANL
jgi:Putative transposase